MPYLGDDENLLHDSGVDQVSKVKDVAQLSSFFNTLVGRVINKEYRTKEAKRGQKRPKRPTKARTSKKVKDVAKLSSFLTHWLEGLSI